MYGCELQVYAIAAYVEGAVARREFGIRNRGGFFTEESGTGDYCDAALDGACSKLLVLQLVRDVSGDTFVEVGFTLCNNVETTAHTAQLQPHADCA